ncbi:TonB-dependent siderophore receptor [Alcaligenaceae bacterium A4P071]|nr:TonB-dependent siderophore receptor [Alcaligenaceae bacterium A4P071]
MLSSRSRRPRVAPLMLCSALAVAFDAGGVHAQAAPAVASATRTYEIPAGALAPALNRVAQEGGVNLTYEPSDTAGKRTRGLSGSYTPTAALRLLLQDSGLAAVATGAGGFRLIAAPSQSDGVSTLAPITVSATTARTGVDGIVAHSATSAMKSDVSLLETPQSISVVTAEQIKAQGAQSVNDALRYTAGVRTESSGSQKLDDNLYLRGFVQGSQDMYQDGLRVITPGYFGFYAGETYGLERIEVLKGPSSVLYGQQSPGGLVNMVSKRPTADPVQEVELTVGNFDRYQTAFDFGGTNDDKTMLYRLVGLGRDANTQVDHVKDDRVYIAPSFTWQPSAATQFTVLTSYQKNRGDYYAQVPASAVLTQNSNGHIPFSRFLGEPDWEGETTERMTAGYAFSHRFNERVKFEQNMRYSHFDNHRQYLQANGGLVDERFLNRRYTVRDIKGDGVALDNRLNVDFDTGALAHKTTWGIDYLWGKSHWNEQIGTASRIDIYNPVYGAVPNTSVFTSKSLQDITASQVGLYAQDQIKYDKWVATLGVRQDWAWRDTKNRTTRIDTKQTDDAFTWRGGLTYLSDSGLAPYVSYSQSFSPVVGSDRLGNAYVPEEGQQYEVGVKFQPAGYNSFITVSAFNLARQNVQTIDPINTNFSVQTGEVRVRGLEVEGVAALDNGVSLTAAYTYNDAEITKTNIAAQKGNTPFRVPKHAASAWVNYDFQVAALQGLSVGTGVRYIGSTMGDDGNTFKVPAFTLVDAALRYDFGKSIPAAKGLTGSINVSNLFDKYYVPACFTVNACNYGASRTIIGSLNYRW